MNTLNTITSTITISEYHLKYHLGNTRVAVNQAGTVTQTNNYYPFGMRFGYSENGSTNKYLYNDKELQEETDWLDYGARFYMADIGRWGAIDPLAEKYFGYTPYTYCINNPIIFIDPDGEAVWISSALNKKTGVTTITFRAEIKVNISNKYVTKSMTKEHANAIKSQIEKSFQGNDGKTKYNTIVELDFDSKIDKSKDLYIDFVSPVEEGDKFSTTGRVDEIGNSNTNRMQVLLETTLKKETIQTPEESGETGAHEFGHTVGLRHPNYQDEANPDNYSQDNLMIQSGNGVQIDVSQFKTMTEIVSYLQQFLNPIERDVKNHY